jgi:thymidylate kinase
MNICFLGPDGSGKSTIIDEIMSLSKWNKQCQYFHLKPLVNPINNSNVPVDAPHMYSSYPLWKSYLKLVYFIFQYNLGWLRNISRFSNRPQLIVFDRYFDDIIVDHKRYRYGGSIAIAKFVRLFIPRPKIYFILTTSANVIYQRKQEVPFEELSRQIKAYQSLADGNRYFNIDVNRPPSVIAEEVIEIMKRKFNEV